MLSELFSLSLEEQAERLTEELVKIKSYNQSNGEVQKADFIYHLLQTFPYFKENPLHVWTQDIPFDSARRKNVFAFFEKSPNHRNTIIYHAHIDTVGVEDYGNIEEFAHNPKRLEEFFSKYDGDEELRSDAQSGDWLFGRGALDMQSGVAIHLVNLLYYTEHADELNGNLLVMFNPDEEGQHAGVRSALHELMRLKNEKNLHYVSAVNNDFITPLFDGDTNKYIYTGVAGKLLPSFYIAGREAHVGDSLSGVDPTLVASELNSAISQNFDLVEKVADELVLPPSCLHLRDDKKSYDVQTAVSCKLYFNYFIYEKSPKDVLNQLSEIANMVCENIQERLKQTYIQFRLTNGLPERELDWHVKVTTIEDYVNELKGKGIDTDGYIQEELQKRDVTEDERMVAFRIVEGLHFLDPEKKPRVILFFAPPFLPSNYVSSSTTKGMRIQQVVESVMARMGEEYKIRKYFPYLSDGSFLSFNGTKEDMDALNHNFPGMNQLFPLPLIEMKELNIPSINIGVYGKGGHKWTERVYKPYTFHVLPKLIREVTNQLLEKA
jgi:arginine utilization protein RocB